jgi:acetolactate synthase-1/2/3 large subunit
MNGADRLCDVLLANDVDVCFANPGTSEMHFVAALDRRPEMRCVLGLFEGVVTAAADGYARMADKPAATLLHTGPGLAHGLANLHNAKRARTPMINVVGDHATYHLQYDAPLTSDIDSLARPMSNFVHRIANPEDVGPATEEAYRAALAMPGVATLILPGDAAWNPVEPAPVVPVGRPALAPPDPEQVRSVAKAIRAAKAGGPRPALLLTGGALRAKPLETAGRIATAAGVRIMAPMSNGRIERGAGRVAIDKIPYNVEPGCEFMADVDLLVLVGAKVPMTFFAYPGKPSLNTRPDCEVMTLADWGTDFPQALAALADELGVPASAALPPPREPALHGMPTGPLNADAVCHIVGALLPENAIVCDESVTSGRMFYSQTHAAPPHDYLQLTGGAIGIGVPLAAGAAVACPDRKVIGLQADGSAMYTIQGLWTQARENLDVITVIFANRTYAILHHEMRNVGVNHFGRNAARMLNLDEPALDFVQMARSMGVEAERASTSEEFARAMRAALSRKGPFLIEAVI